jgi:ABC-type polysaccharide/polyol phosphate export permease
MFFQLLFGLGLGFIFSTLHVFFRDTAQLVGVLLIIWMFGTPLFYPESMIPLRFRFLVDINPMAYLVRMFRTVCLKNMFPNVNDVIIFAVISVTILLIGYSIYTKKFYQFVDQL